MSSNFFDQFDESTARPVGKGGNFFDQFDPTGAKPVPKTNLLDDVKDSAIALGTGVTQGIGMLANVAGADNAVSRTMADATQALSEYESPYRKAEKQERARKIKEAEESGSTLKEVGAYLGSFAEAPIDTTLNALGTSLPTLAAGFIPGAGQAAVAARVAQMGLGAAQGVGAVKGQIFDEVKQAWKEKGATEEEAAARATQAQSYTGDNAGSIALGGALGAVAGSSGAEASVRRLAGKEVAERAAQTSVLKGMGMGALKEAPMEGLQGGQERLASNLALQNEGFDQGTWTGVAGGAALEATASAPMGAGFGAWEAGSQQRLAQQEQQRRTEIEQQAAQQQANIDTTGGTPPASDAFAQQLASASQAAAKNTSIDEDALNAWGVPPKPSIDTRQVDRWLGDAPAQPAAPTPAPQRPSEAMGLRTGPEAGPLENLAAQSVDSGLSAQMQEAAAPAQEPEAPKRADIVALDYSNLNDADRAAYDDYFASVDEQTDDYISWSFNNIDNDIPDFGDASNVSEENFLRHLGASEQEIFDALQTTNGARGPQESAAGNAAPQANEPAGASEVAGGNQAAQGQAQEVNEAAQLQAELQSEQAAASLPDAPDGAFASVQEDAGDLPAELSAPQAAPAQPEVPAPGSQSKGANVATLAQLNRKKLAEMTDGELQQLSALLPADHSRQPKIQKAIQDRAAQAQQAINTGAKDDGPQTNQAQQSSAQQPQAGAAQETQTAPIIPNAAPNAGVEQAQAAPAVKVRPAGNAAQNQAQAPAAPQQTPTWATMPTEARQQVIQAAGLNKPQATKALATNSIEEMPAAIADKLAPVLSSAAGPGKNSKPNQPQSRTQQAQAATENAADTNTQEGAAKAQETVEDELSQRGKLVADFVQAVISGSAHPNSIRVGPISADAGQRMAEKTAVPVQGAVEIVIADSVIHANKRHPDLTLEDWSRLPEVTNAFDDASLGQPGPNQNMARIVVRKSTQADGSGYGAVYDFAAGGNKGRKKLNLVTYFRGTEKSLNSWWEKNKGADPAAVPNLPEPASSARDDVSAPSGASLPSTATAAQPVTRADVEAAQQQAAAIMGARIDAMSAGSKFNARQAQEAGFKAREEAKKAQRQAKRTQAAPEDTGLRVGVAPGSADPVTVRDGVVLIGDYEAVNYDTGEPVTVPKGSTRADVAQALKNAGALSSRQKMFGLGDKAQDVMFSQNLLSPAASAPKPTLDQIQRLVDKVQQLAKDGFLVRVTSSPVNVPGVKVPAGAKPTGAVIDGNIYLFTDNLSSIGDAYVTMFHEIFHLGLQKVLPAEDYATVLKQFASNPLAAKVVRQWKASAEGTEKAAKMPSAAYEALATEEALAMIAEELSVNDGEGTRNMPGLVKKMLSWFAQVADKLGFPPNFSNWVRNLTRTDAERFVNDMTRAVLGGSKNLAKTKAKYGTMAAEMTAQDRLRAPPVVYHGTKSALTQFDPANSDIRFSRAPAAAPAFDFAAMAKAVLAGTPQKDKDAVVNRVRQTIAPMRAAWGANAPEVEVVFNMSDPRVPRSVRLADEAQRSNGAEGEPEGFYYRGTVYLVASQLPTPNDMVRVLAHEVLGHHGLRGKFGPQLDGILSQIATMRKAQVQEKMRQYGLRDTPANRAHAAEEVLAEMAEKQPQLPFVRRAVAAIRNFLRAHVPGFRGLALKDDDIIQAFLLPARGWVERSGRGAGAGSELDQAVPAMQRGGVEDDAAFSRASQAKAVGDVGNPGTDDVGNSAWDAPVQTGFDDVIYKLQDKHIDLKRVVESITKSVGKVADDINAYLKEELFHKRAAKRVADFGARELTPLMNQMRLAGLSMEDVEEYLHARHAKEANAALAERNPSQAMINAGRAKAAQEVTALAAKLEAVTDKTQRSILQKALGNATKELNRWNVVVPYKGTEESRLMLSGMSDKDADSYFAKLDPAQRAKLDAVAKKVDAIIAGTRKLYVDYGLEDQAVVDGWASLYKHYIPLMREDKDGGMGIGQGFSVKGKEVKGRTGSTRKVVDILANIASQREKLIVRGEKNRVIQALVGLAQANPNPDFWEVRSQAPTERVVDEATNTVVERPIPNFKGRDNVVVAKTKDSKGNVTEQMVVFNEDNPRAVRMAAALKNLDAGNLEGLLGVSAKITRYFAAINTQYNPVFGVVNLIRDVQGAMVNLAATPLAGQQAKIAKDTFSALLGIYSDIRKTRKGGEATSQWAQLWEQMQEDGGTTGYREMFQTSADRANNLKSILNPEGWMDSKWGKVFTANGQLKVPMSIAQKGAAEIFGWLSDYNEAMENGVRLAAYKAALDKKMSREQAASIAKNLTVNFNRKGQIGQQAGAVYAFFNAAMQGTARIGQTLFDMDGGDISTLRLSKTGKAVVYGGVTLGVIQALLLAAAGFDDEDPPEFLRERSLIIPVGGKAYVTIPMPLGLHVIPGIGRHATEFALSGFDKPAKRAVSVIGMFADAFNPIGNAGLSMQTLAPTALDPLVALTENKDSFGRTIARTSFNKALPGHTQWKDTATGFSKVVAEAINWVSGGNEYVAGALSPTPDQIDYLLAQLGGGVAREIAKVQQTISTAISGEELPTYKIPLVGRFVGSAASQASQGNAFYANLERMNELETEIKGLRKDGKYAEAAQLARENPASMMIAMANKAERDVQKLRREKRELIANDASREQVRAKEQQITAVMTRLNEAAARRLAPA